MRIVMVILVLLPGLAMADSAADGGVPAGGDAKQVVFYAPPALVDSGLIAHIAPRFTLKTQVRVTQIDDPARAEVIVAQSGPTPLFTGLGETWHLDLRGSGAGAARFADWLTSEVGRRTVLGFAPEGAPLFTEPAIVPVAVAPSEISGDARAGQSISADKCGRCHVTERGGGGFGLDSTPSFFVMRGFADWQLRFEQFYALKPHGAFTQLHGVTPPFPAERPSPIVAVELSVEDLEAILAYVAHLAPADLGKPLKHQ